jgi:hypothetical protein
MSTRPSRTRWAVHRVFQIDALPRPAHRDYAFLERCFHKLLYGLPPGGSTAKTRHRDERSAGGFLGLDNIGVFDRSSAAAPRRHHPSRPTAPRGWPCYCLNMLTIALELAEPRYRAYEDIASKFFEHFLYDRERHEHARRQRALG